MRKVAVLGVGMTCFGKFPEQSLKDLGCKALETALQDAALAKAQLQAAYVGNAIAGLITGQEMIRGQVVLRAAGIGSIPVANVENACASSSTAFHLAWIAVASGLYDCVLALGVEKMTHPDKSRTFQALATALDVQEMQELSRTLGLGDTAGQSHSIFMDIYAQSISEYMARYGATKLHLAKISAKNHFNASLNEYAQYREPLTAEDVLKDRLIVEPLTRAMCAPIADGGAAAILCSAKFARRFTSKPIYVAATVLDSAAVDCGEPKITERASRTAYEKASIGPGDVDLLEVHDATAAAELQLYEQLGLCGPGEALRLVDLGFTELRGPKPVNPSGGLECRGHPVGATGLAQIAELVWQLRGQAKNRQVKGGPKVALAHNAGGHLGTENAASCITILER